MTHTLDNFSFTLDNYSITFYRTLESLCTRDDFNFTKLSIDRVMACSTKGASYCCLRKAVPNK